MTSHEPGTKPSTIQAAELVLIFVVTQTHMDLVRTTTNKELLRQQMSE